MTSKELYEEYLIAMKERMELEEKIENLIEKCTRGETKLSTKLIEDAVQSGYDRLNGLRNLERTLRIEYEKQTQKEEDKRISDINIRILWDLVHLI